MSSPDHPINALTLFQELKEIVPRMEKALISEALESIVIEGTALAVRPQFVRLPSVGERCPWTGLHRQRLWEIFHAGGFGNWFQDPPGSGRPVTLYHLPSLENFMREEMERQKLARAERDESQDGQAEELAADQ